ncbi:MAG: DUF1501 domain-containing protein [Pelagibacteraceae bacterium]|jgi:uncharacterized protein (DUF1501 family)|nr:DUF1501 domain-containing protein [Pelagibacteraceae bacterium]MBT3901360.1 DUF1501 domain-containing protein [Pelagibacteraceae bacterium]MBT4645363.1 DUF1501 domain-containing protein [Pelagibacteraceae bacterium]MBT4951676.1 DUF1501 domain-containing protein [Pelagibacteraceae bacterium]MBT5214626.1 DUF1501 domain-containing protein [Pelagibacteraceae bacterium]
MNCTRRNFLIGGSSTLFLSGFYPKISFANTQKKNLIIISLRGGMDGLTAVPVIGDKRLKKLRKQLILENTLKLNSDFALHPKLKIFHELWEKNKAAFVHATNIPYTGRSHFDGQNLMETGAHTPYKEKTGWLGRGLLASDILGKGLAISLPMPLLLRGVPQNNNFFPSPDFVETKLIDSIYNEFSGEHNKLIKSTLGTIKKRPLSMQVATNSYDRNKLAREAAKQLHDPNGPRVAVFELDGFDTHTAQGGADGAHAEQLEELNNIVKILYKNLGSSFDNTLILTLTEFGRTIKQNGGYGTEHGYGSAILMAGGLLKKSQVYTDWPGLKKKDLFEGRDLNSTIDARAVYNSAMSVCFNKDPEFLKREVFWDDDLPDLTQELFKV